MSDRTHVFLSFLLLYLIPDNYFLLTLSFTSKQITHPVKKFTMVKTCKFHLTGVSVLSETIHTQTVCTLTLMKMKCLVYIQLNLTILQASEIFFRLKPTYDVGEQNYLA